MTIERTHLPRKDLAIVLIDMQKDFLDGIPLKVRSDLFKNQRMVLEYARDNNIIVYGFEYIGEGDTAYSLKQVIDENPYGVILPKERDSCFERTKFKERIERDGIDHLFLMGIFASGCVKATARHALGYGLTLTTAQDVVEDRLIAYETEIAEDTFNFFMENSTLYQSAEEFMRSL